MSKFIRKDFRPGDFITMDSGLPVITKDAPRQHYHHGDNAPADPFTAQAELYGELTQRLKSIHDQVRALKKQ